MKPNYLNNAHRLTVTNPVCLTNYYNEELIKQSNKEVLIINKQLLMVLTYKYCISINALQLIINLLLLIPWLFLLIADHYITFLVIIVIVSTFMPATFPSNFKVFCISVDV